LRIDAYADHYNFPWIKFRTDAPGQGKDYLVQLTYQPNKQFELYTRFRTEQKSINETTSDSALHFLVQKKRQNLRLNFIYHFNPAFTFKTRADVIWYNKKANNAEEGFLIYAEGAYRFSSKLSGNLRMQYFETGGFNSRIYAYESDVLYGYSIPPFFDKGIRYYTNINYDVNKKLSFWVRFAQTRYHNKNNIGSGLDEIKGNKRSEMKIQMRYFI
jgi:hypothetical protein